MDRYRIVLGLALACAASTACAWGNYRVVTQTPEGGEVALLGSGESEARKKAEAFMTTACPNGHDIIEESEALAGDDSSAPSPASKDLLGHTKQPSTAVANEDRRESRLKYRCKPRAD